MTGALLKSEMVSLGNDRFIWGKGQSWNWQWFMGNSRGLAVAGVVGDGKSTAKRLRCKYLLSL